VQLKRREQAACGRVLPWLGSILALGVTACSRYRAFGNRNALETKQFGDLSNAAASPRLVLLVQSLLAGLSVQADELIVGLHARE